MHAPPRGCSVGGACMARASTSAAFPANFARRAGTHTTNDATAVPATSPNSLGTCTAVRGGRMRWSARVVPPQVYQYKVLICRHGNC
jgi:hypothetical protein